MNRLTQLIRDHSFFNISLKERSGIPDEARPTIIVTLASGKSHRVAKWMRDMHPDFDAIYDALLEQVRLAQKVKPVFEGRFDPQWVPDGFVAP